MSGQRYTPEFKDAAVKQELDRGGGYLQSLRTFRRLAAQFV